MPPKSISFASLHPSVREKLRAKGNEIRASTQRFLHGKLVSERIQAQKDVNRHIKEFRENLEATGFGGASEERGPEVLKGPLEFQEKSHCDVSKFSQN
jgi:hypothetical protein